MFWLGHADFATSCAFAPQTWYSTSLSHMRALSRLHICVVSASYWSTSDNPSMQHVPLSRSNPVGSPDSSVDFNASTIGDLRSALVLLRDRAGELRGSKIKNLMRTDIRNCKPPSRLALPTWSVTPRLHWSIPGKSRTSLTQACFVPENVFWPSFWNVENRYEGGARVRTRKARLQTSASAASLMPA
ncbi:hypothetical protein ACVWZL_000127 [Bradyrhizobium sp. GM2.4]